MTEINISCICLNSWTYDGFQVDLVHINQLIDNSNEIPIGIDLRDYYQSVEWDIMNVPAKRNVKIYFYISQVKISSLND